MHAIFIPYGKRSELELFYREAEAQKFFWPRTKGKETVSEIWAGQIRMLPFGFVEYIFPQANKDIVLNTLNFDNMGSTYSEKGKKPYLDVIGKSKFYAMRKMVDAEPIPEFEKGRRLIWNMPFIKIIPIGIRTDPVHEDKNGEWNGWTYEHL